MGDILAFIGASWYAWMIAGIVGVAIALVLWTQMEGNSGCITGIAVGLVVGGLIFGIMAGFSAYTTVQRGTVGLVSRFGALTGTVFQPGLHWKTPFIETVEVFDTTQQSYETSEYPDQTKAQWPDYWVTSQTSDGQTVKVSYTLIFRIPDGETAVGIRQDVGPIEEVVENCVKATSRSTSRNTSRLFKAAQLYSGDVVEYQDEVFDSIRDQFNATCGGLILVDFKVRGIQFEEKYSDAIEAKQIEAERIIKEENAAQAAVFEAQKTAELAKGEAQAAIERARGDAEAVRVAADADAYAVQVDADAQAYATEEIGRALQRYPAVLQLRFIENLGSQTVWLPSSGLEFLLPAPE